MVDDDGRKGDLERSQSKSKTCAEVRETSEKVIVIVIKDKREERESTQVRGKQVPEHNLLYTLSQDVMK